MWSYSTGTRCALIADGDLGAYGKVEDAYMKQKHRMIWERRHGPVGTGMKDSGVSEDNHWSNFSCQNSDC